MAVDLRKKSDLISPSLSRKAEMDGAYMKAMSQKKRIQAILDELDKSIDKVRDEQLRKDIALQRAEAEMLMDFCNTVIKHITKFIEEA
jgi:hypothetical protein